MTVTPPPVHVPRPYERPHANLACRVDVPCEDGAVVAAFVYAPHGVRDQPGTPFGIDPHVPPVLMLHGNRAEQRLILSADLRQMPICELQRTRHNGLR